MTSSLDHVPLYHQARETCEEQQRDAEDAQQGAAAQPEVPLRPGPTFRKTETLTHFLLCAAVFFSFAFYRTLPSLQQKLMGALLTPVGRHSSCPFPCLPAWRQVVCTSATDDHTVDEGSPDGTQIVAIYVLMPSSTRHSAPTVRAAHTGKHRRCSRERACA